MISPRLHPNCPAGGFGKAGHMAPNDPAAKHHCGCNTCCFCGRPHPAPIAPPKVKHAGRVRGKGRARASL